MVYHPSPFQSFGGTQYRVIRTPTRKRQSLECGPSPIIVSTRGVMPHKFYEVLLDLKACQNLSEIYLTFPSPKIPECQGYI